MIKDVTNVILIPGNQGRDCPGNGENPNVECCCDECDYLLCCVEPPSCDACANEECPRKTGRDSLPAACILDSRMIPSGVSGIASAT